ncbi:VirB10 Type IV secretory pathway, VirB10 components [uncultured Caudovirales phage]|uniref:VirB10 Type IV secretory pathway, VirB10 components n=1 Tax=uncultured Caudovirales phage TaxID=2100421 RepID=A0A6J5RKM6_9CAUD|nr:VirB10 Type IV secretory pathway, VirB10 components [uncultured Caudovirales phage]
MNAPVAQPRRARRISRRPLYVAFLVMASFVLCYLLIVRAMQQPKEPVAETLHEELASSKLPDRLKSPMERPQEKIDPPAEKTAPPPDEEKHHDEELPPDPLPPPAEKRLTLEEQTKFGAALAAWQVYWQQKAALNQKLYDDRIAGLTSPIDQQVAMPHPSAAPAEDGPSALNPQQPSGKGGGQFASADNNNSWLDSGSGKYPEVLQSFRHGPAYEYQIMATTPIPFTTTGGIITDSPGVVAGKVSKDVPCNTPAGLRSTLPCIPAGTTIQISYNDRVKNGDRRITVACDRFIFPDTTSMQCGHQIIADVEGYGGLADQRDTHLGERVLNAALFTVVQSAGTLGAAALGANNVSTQPVQSVAQEEAQEGMHVPPTLKIRPHFPGVVMLKQDLAFEAPYEPRDTGENSDETDGAVLRAGD